MGKVQTKSKHPHRSKHRGIDGSRKAETQEPAVLLVQASQFLQLGNPEAALPLAEKAVRLCSRPSNAQYSLPSFNLLAQIEIELGDPDAAREHFKAAIDLDPNGDESEELGGGAEKFLWLAQLSEEGGRDSIRWFERGAAILEREIGGLQGKMDGEEELEEKKTKLASALCGMIEVWMTDLSQVLLCSCVYHLIHAGWSQKQKPPVRLLLPRLSCLVSRHYHTHYKLLPR